METEKIVIWKFTLQDKSETFLVFEGLFRKTAIVLRGRHLCAGGRVVSLELPHFRRNLSNDTTLRFGN
jgi:hypothetical protein